MYLSPCILKKNMLFELTAAFYSLDFWFIMHTTDEDRVTEKYILVLKCIKKKYPQNASSLTIRKKKTPAKFSVEKRQKFQVTFRYFAYF